MNASIDINRHGQMQPAGDMIHGGSEAVREGDFQNIETA